VTDTPTEREDEGAWAKLRRRKVVQWGLAYAASAWVLLQGVALVRDTFGWSHTIQQVVMLLLLIGLPVALVLAWYHGDHGHQRVTRLELAILTVLFLLGGGALWLYGHRSTPSLSTTTSATPTPAPTPTATTAPADTRPSIAVLPFENRSAKQDDAYFVDGIHDDILTQLTKIGAMKVIARTSVEQFRDTKLTTKEIGDKLGVTRVLEGGVQRAGDRVRVTVQLIDTATDGHLWAETYDRELTAANIFAIQSEVAAAIAGALNATLSASETAQVNAIPTQNLEAWQAYQLGRQQMANLASANLKNAQRYFQKAIELDPTFALPYAGLADSLILQVGWANAPLTDNLAQAKQLVRKALELGPDLAESWASSALVAILEQNYARAETDYRKALELNPNYASAYVGLGRVLMIIGRPDEALVYSEKGHSLDPLSSDTNFRTARVLAFVGRFDDAEARYRKVVELDPMRAFVYRDLAMLSAYARNNFVAAIPLAEKLVELDPNGPYARCNLADLYIDLGELAGAERVLELARTEMPRSSEVLSCLAWLRLTLGDEAGSTRIARQSIELDPDDTQGQSMLAWIDVNRGDYASARTRYARQFPELLGTGSPEIPRWNIVSAIDLVLILRMTGETERANQILDRVQEATATMPRLGESGYGIADAQIHALRGDKDKALAALREAEKAGWRGPFWRYYRDFDPNLASIRNEPEFKAVFADIERDMARQRAELAKRPKNAPPNLVPVR
jgi:TolB-like protein/Tfp pilus assembly protein PilF